MSAAAVDSKGKVATIHSKIESALRGEVDDNWDIVLDDWASAAPSQRKAVRAYVSGLRNRMYRTLMEIDSIEELERGVAIQYVEVKAHWMMLNTQIQHQTDRDGRAADDLIYRATCVSLIVQALEPLLTQTRVDSLTNFLAEPFDE
ncbi:hypothetical protein CRI94_06090 [Longibacter salinarum]|uniref:Uncharacterized protein n=1 Tax=Longibacter salinarum TaxID=1850348 RepID=A0A2A8D0T8_9BACT|nr:hypothetical protein [Longibacter salinarum]PEN14589.1 hypothetical protein CRI94_06090 [Longibacter salinarum]